jgi:hypothetical protein
MADYLGVKDPPQVEVARYVYSEELDGVLRHCLEEAGYPTGSNGGVDVPTGNEDAFALARYTCYMKYPVPEKYTQTWTDEQLRNQYAWTTGFVIPCLEEHGHPIAPPPSESVFIDSWASDPYFPFAEVRLSVPQTKYDQAWDELEAACLQQAPDEVLWDSMSVAEWKERHR